MKKKPIILSWSGGKDCSYCLHKLLLGGEYEIKFLLSTMNGRYKRLSMHGIREELIEAQSKCIGIPLRNVYVFGTSNEEYEEQMGKMLAELKSEGLDTIAFGDIFLEDLRTYREEKLKALAMHAIFPLWKSDTRLLLQDFIEKKFVAYTCCINDGYLTKAWAGRKLDLQFLEDIPASVDCCGENGEFHTFCTDGPVFRQPVAFSKGGLEYRPLEIKSVDPADSLQKEEVRGFWFCDFLPF